MTRLFPTVLILALILSVAAFFWFANQHRQSYETELLREMEVLIDQHVQEVASDLKDVRSDLSFLANSASLRTFLDDQGTSPSVTPLAQDFLWFSETKKKYDQIRYLDDDGSEIVRINFNRGQPQVVPEEDLQHKQHRYYVTETMKLERGQIYVSPFDLNVEGREIELPIKPVVRFSTRVFDGEGRSRGFIIVNYLGERILERFHHRRSTFAGQLLLIDENGYFLVGPTPEHEWAFMFAHKSDLRFQSNFPNIWSEIMSQSRGQSVTDDGLFAFTRIGAEYGLDQTESCRECSWAVVVHVPTEILDVHENAWMRDMAPYAVLLFLLLVLSGGVTQYNMSKSKKVDALVGELHSAIALERDAFVGGPTVVFRWRNAYGWPVEYVSNNVRSVLGYDPDQFTQGHLSYSSIVEPDFLQFLAEDIVAAKKRNLTSFERRPYQLVKQDGGRLWVQDFTTAVRDENGAITHFIGYINDITALKSAERELKQQRAYIEEVVNAIADPTMVINVKDHSIVLANRAASDLYLSGGATPPGITCHALSHRQDQPCSGKDDPCPIHELLQTKQSARVTHRHFDGKGNDIYVELTAAPILNDEGEVTQFIESHRDITERVLLENELVEAKSGAEAANEAKSRLLANVSHDLRTPLNAIIGFSEMMKGEYFGPMPDQHYKEYVSDIHKSGRFLLDLINDLLDLSKAEAGKYQLDERAICVSDTISSALRIMDPLAQSAKVGLTSDVAEDLPQMIADERVMERVFNNLLSNAIKFTEPEGTVNIGAQKNADNHIIIDVSDTGVGMTEKELQEALKPFVQTDSSISRKSEGTGLGLSLCERFVTMHGGTLTLSSEVGKGTTVTLDFPPEKTL